MPYGDFQPRNMAHFPDFPQLCSKVGLQTDLPFGDQTWHLKTHCKYGVQIRKSSILCEDMFIFSIATEGSCIIGLRFFFTGNPDIFHGQNHGFQLRFSLQPLQ